MVLGFGEMLEEDRPDYSIWLDDKALNDFFEARKIERAQGSSGTGPDDWDDWERDPNVVTNEYAEAMLREAGVQ